MKFLPCICRPLLRPAVNLLKLRLKRGKIFMLFHDEHMVTSLVSLKLGKSMSSHSACSACSSYRAFGVPATPVKGLSGRDPWRRRSSEALHPGSSLLKDWPSTLCAEASSVNLGHKQLQRSAKSTQCHEDSAAGAVEWKSLSNAAPGEVSILSCAASLG